MSPSESDLCLDAETMKIWIDADACPAAVKEIISRAAHRVRVPVFVANKKLTLPRSEFLSAIRVGAGLDVADIVIHEAPFGNRNFESMRLLDSPPSAD